MVPRILNAADGGGPLLQLERQILDASSEIEHWFRSQWLSHTPPFYASVDLRNAGFKLSVVDTNLFPGGFNNLSEDALPLACLLYTSPSPRDRQKSRMPSSA